MIMSARFIARQLGHPSGAIGRWILGPLWNRRNRALNDVSLEQLALQADDRVLEVGFGGGYLLGRMSPLVTDGFIGGVDISAATVEQCRAHYRAVIQTGKMDLKVGTAPQILARDRAEQDRGRSVAYAYRAHCYLDTPSGTAATIL
jgi:hypothetical protein